MIVGSYAVLRMGTFHEESKGMVPLEVWTFFAQEDLVVETGPLNPGFGPFLTAMTPPSNSASSEPRALRLAGGQALGHRYRCMPEAV